MILDMARRKRVEKVEKGARANVTLDGEAADALRAVCKRFTRTHKEFVEFAAKWMLRQIDEVAGPIMGALPSAYTPDFAKVVLTRMAAGDVPVVIPREPSSASSAEPQSGREGPSQKLTEAQLRAAKEEGEKKAKPKQ